MHYMISEKTDILNIILDTGNRISTIIIDMFIDNW